MNKFIFINLIFYNVAYASWFAHDKAACLMQQGKWQPAKEILQKVVTDKPDSPKALYDAGIASYRTKDFNQALAYFKQVTQLAKSTDKQKEQAYFNAGNTAVELKKLKEAIELYEAALGINPNNEQAKYNLEKVKEMLKQQEQQNQKQEKEQKENKKEEQEKQSQEKQDKNQQEQQKKEQEDKSETENQPGGEQKGDENKDKKEKGEKNPQEKEEQSKQDKEREKEKQAQSKSQEEQEKNAQEKEEGEQGEGGQEEQEEHNESDENGQESADQNKKEEKKGQEAGQVAHDDKNQKQEKGQKVEAWLAHLLKEQEEKDAALNKQMIKATVEKTLVGNDGQNCW